MAGWDGNGLFEVTHTWVNDKDNSIPITASRMDQNTADTTSGLNNVVTRDGQNAATANLPMGGNKHTGVANGAARTDYLAVGQFQDNSTVYFATTGSANAYVLGLAPAITAYAAGQEFLFKANFTNTGSATININALGAKTIQFGSRNLVGGEIDNNQLVKIVYDGTNFQIISTLNDNYTMLNNLLNLEIFS